LLLFGQLSVSGISNFSEIANSQMHLFKFFNEKRLRFLEVSKNTFEEIVYKHMFNIIFAFFKNNDISLVSNVDYDEVF